MSGWSDEGRATGGPGRHGGPAAPEAAAPGLERPSPGHAPGVAAQPRRPRRPPREQRQRPPRDPGGGARRPPEPAGPGAGGAASACSCWSWSCCWSGWGSGSTPAQPGRGPADYEGRPAATPGADWLIVGSDSRQGLDEARRRELGTGQAAGRRADTMMLLHIPRGTGKPVLISLPRDSYVPIPATAATS